MYDWAEFRHFRYLLTVLELQGFRAAADQLNTAQPNLSVQAKQFQENASLRLYRRTKSGRIRVTETGIAFKSLARFLLETRDEVIDALVAIERGEIHAVRFGCAALANQSLFQGLCALHKELLPTCSIRPTHGDTVQLSREVLAGRLDAAIVTLPLVHPDLKIEELRSDRLVVCLRSDCPLAVKATLQPSDLQNNLAVLYDPERHPDAHDRLLEMLADAGISVQEYSRASHPSEMQTLVKEGFLVGFRLPAMMAFPTLAIAAWLIVRNHPKMFQLWAWASTRRATMTRANAEHIQPVPWFAKAGAACSIVPIARFVSDHLFALKGRGHGCLFSLTGLDEEFLTDQELDSHLRMVEGALRGLPEGACLYQYSRVRSGFQLPKRDLYLMAFGAAAAIGGLGGLAQIGSNGSVLTPSTQIRNGISEQTAAEGEQVLNHFLNRLPVITLKEGSRARVYIGRDILIPSYAEHRVDPTL
jgi:DNA-binding transcriptional LysR family regulator